LFTFHLRKYSIGQVGCSVLLKPRAIGNHLTPRFSGERFHSTFDAALQ
jgi:hypothetical protein